MGVRPKSMGFKGCSWALEVGFLWSTGANVAHVLTSHQNVRWDTWNCGRQIPHRLAPPYTVACGWRVGDRWNSDFGDTGTGYLLGLMSRRGCELALGWLLGLTRLSVLASLGRWGWC